MLLLALRLGMRSGDISKLTLDELDFDQNYVFLRMIAPYHRITTSVLRFETTKHFKKAEINISGKKHGPHTLRSSLATLMVNDDIPYDVIRTILWYADPDSVMHYEKLDIEKSREYAIEVTELSSKFKNFLDGEIG